MIGRKVEEGEKGRSIGNGLGERNRKVSKKEGAKECSGRKREEGEQKGRGKGNGLGEMQRKVSKKD